MSKGNAQGGNVHGFPGRFLGRVNLSWRNVQGLVNRETHRRTDMLWPSVLLAQPAELKKLNLQSCLCLETVLTDEVLTSRELGTASWQWVSDGLRGFGIPSSGILWNWNVPIGTFYFLFTLQNHKKQDHSRSAIRLGETAPDIPYPNNYQNLTGTTSSKDRSTKKCSRGSDQIFQTDTMCWRIIRKIPRCGSRYGWFPELNQFFLVHKYLSGKMNIRIVVFRWQTDISNAQTIRSRQQCSINMTLKKIFFKDEEEERRLKVHFISCCPVFR